MFGNGAVQLVSFIFIFILCNSQAFRTCTSKMNVYLQFQKAILSPVLASTEPEILVPTRVIYEEGHIDVDPFICKNPYGNITLIIMVTSAVKNRRARMDIRLTWGHWSVRNDVKVVFTVGQTSDKKVQFELQNEQNLFHDIAQGNFMDTYRNLTLKTVFMLEWVSINCPNAAFVLKTDDDMFINVPKLLDYLTIQNPQKRTIYGKLYTDWRPYRNSDSKYYVSMDEYKDLEYPKTIGGAAYVFPGFLASEMFQASLNHKFFKLEDVFLTGLVAKELGINHTHWAGFYNLEYDVLDPCKLQNVVSVHNVTEKRQFEAWSKANDFSVECKQCNKFN